MADLDKLYEKADKYLQRQKFDAAIETFEEILRHDPEDEESLIRLADLNLKINHLPDALRYQLQLTEFYLRRGDNANAIAGYRKIVKLSPQDASSWSKLATLLEKSEKYSEAAGAYREALAQYRRAGLSPQMIECLSHIVRLDPDSLEAQAELGELAGRARQVQLAVPALLRAAQLSREAGDEERWEKLVDQAHALNPADESTFGLAAELRIKHGNFAEAIGLLMPLLASTPDDIRTLELACQAQLGMGNHAEAEPLCWKLYRRSPERVSLLLRLLEGLLQRGNVAQVLSSLSQLKDGLFRQGKRNEYLQLMEKTYAADESNLDTLEALAELYNELNREEGLRRSLSHLFNLYVAGESYDKAADILERMLDVDPYGEGHTERLTNLEGHIDPIWYENILKRLQPPSTGRAAAASRGRKEHSENLEELLVEGEMYFQYQLPAKLLETAQKIDRQFPGAEEKDQRIRDLFESAGYTPKFRPAAAAPGARTETSPHAAAPFQPIDELRKISEITTNIHRGSTPLEILQVAVNEIGRALNASRCWGGIGSPERPPLLTAEYCSPLTSPSDRSDAMALYTLLMRKAVPREGWACEDVAVASLLTPVRPEIQRLGIRSLDVLPLIDEDAVGGLLLVEQCEAPRPWSAGEALLTRAVAAQVVVAVNNTRQRTVVHSFAGTDPATGLLPRSAYIECLLAESRRSKLDSQPLSVCLLEPQNRHALMKTLDDAHVQQLMIRIGKAVVGALRPNDISVRYSPLAIASLLPDTPLLQAKEAVERVRRAVATVQANGSNVDLCAAICDVPLGASFDPVDGVTEVINRLEVALDSAHQVGTQQVVVSQFAG